MLEIKKKKKKENNIRLIQNKSYEANIISFLFYRDYHQTGNSEKNNWQCIWTPINLDLSS